MLGELCVPIDSDENQCKRHRLILKDKISCTSSFGTDRNNREECNINDCVNEVSAPFIWYEDVNYQAYVSKSDKAFHSSVKHSKPFVENNVHSIW